LEKVKIIVATRATEADFYKMTATGRSLRLYKAPFLEVCLFPENTLGLPEIYNSVIDQSADDPAMLIFAHDDLHILDFFWIGELFNGLSYFQILGMAGNIRRIPRQPNWAFIDTDFTWDASENLSGVVGHGKGFPPTSLSVFGPPRQQVKLLDGLLLCAYSKTLNDNDLRFDRRFDFHFYDMDLCRQAEQKNVTCGTWSISLIHESGGSFGSESWQSAYQKYLEKWGG
jgi:hypothetical protein